MNLREYAQKQQNPPQQLTGGESGRNTPGKAADAYKGIYRAVFDFHKRNSPPPQTPEQWQATAQDLAQTAAATGNSPFANSLLMAVMDELERQAKGAQSMDSS